jgi:2-oxoacid:acceptor oxidoreductase delta subunit (pyruvate/2-ketoisovalerate family)
VKRGKLFGFSVGGLFRAARDSTRNGSTVEPVFLYRRGLTSIMPEINQIVPKACQFEESHRAPLKSEAGLDECTAIKEAQRCLGNQLCQSCDLCRMICPELCITRNTVNGKIEIDLEFCKGCGICAFICPRRAIKMVREE